MYIYFNKTIFKVVHKELFLVMVKVEQCSVKLLECLLIWKPRKQSFIYILYLCSFLYTTKTTIKKYLQLHESIKP